jgi:hypothetical protein
VQALITETAATVDRRSRFILVPPHCCLSDAERLRVVLVENVVRVFRFREEDSFFGAVTKSSRKFQDHARGVPSAEVAPRIRRRFCILELSPVEGFRGLFRLRLVLGHKFFAFRELCDVNHLRIGELCSVNTSG